MIKIKSLSGDTTETFLETDPLSKRLEDWTPDGQSILYSLNDPATRWDLWVLPLNGDRKPRAYLKTRFDEIEGAVSPDGRWITYRSNESGQYEAYVQSFPVPGGKYQVTTEHCTYCVWSSDGKSLYYGVSPDPGHGRQADVQSGGEFRLGAPRLADTFPKDVRDAWYAHQGKRLLATLKSGKEQMPSITVLLDGLPGSSKR